ncbi:coiled-coil domain-containing protein 9-like [Scleropages formosus]|uniref:Coiled-coil domain-containing protein 9-like n=1 Tax=Scleropages formosus TaxID=113540 RepID=A0A0P7WY48_SCLFO|nr:coiled-coil domain-containing protein 9-like [Scleropages formosus]
MNVRRGIWIFCWQSSAVDLKTKEEKDAELDRRIEALRKKNEALVRRYQEIEEDKKKAEQEGIAVTTPRKPRSHEPESDRRRTEKENITVTVDLSKPAGEKRIINEKKPGAARGGRDLEDGQASALHAENSPRRTGPGRQGRGTPRGGSRQEWRESRQDKLNTDKTETRQDRSESRPDRPVWENEMGETPGRTDRTPRGGRRGRGGGSSQGGSGQDRKSKEWEEKRRQNIEKMNEEMEKIAEYERGQRGEGDKNPIRNFLDDPRRCGPIPDADRKEGSRRHVRNWGGLDFENVKTRAEQDKEWTSRRPSTKGSIDMTMSMTGRERAEYLRWKKEREQIDEERLARHRNATGQWRREWDAQKTDTMFKEEPAVVSEGIADQGSGRDDNRRPPKAPTFGDFMGHSKAKEGGFGRRGKAKGRAQSKTYSMHDNRWEGETEKEKATEEKPPAKEKKNKPPVFPQVEVVVENSNDAGAMDDDDEWEDASDGEEEEEEEEVIEEEEAELEEESEKPAVQQEKTKQEDSSPPPAASPLSPKEQRSPRPKVQMPIQQDSPESNKPISPFSPGEGYQPVTDWGEEMEMQSPRSSLGESPLKPEQARTECSPETPKPSSPAHAEEQLESKAASPPEEQDMQAEGDAADVQDSDPSQSTVGTVTVTEDPEQSSSGAVQITNFETVAFRKKSLTFAEL